MFNIEIFEQIADEKGCDIAFPIKEAFLIQVVKQFVERLKNDEGNLIFGGGTSLVCAYNELTKRFSEDADFRFVPKPKSTKNIRETLTKIAETLDGFVLTEEPLSDSHKIEFRLSDKENLIKKHSSLRPYIKLEIFFTDNLFYKPEPKRICSFYDRAMGIKDDLSVACVSLEDTTIDKISSFLWRILSNTTEIPQYNPADIRHLHDLVFLSEKINIDNIFKQNLLTVFTSDMKQRLKTDINLYQIISNVLQELNKPNYQKDYEVYVSNMSYAKENEKVSFDKAMSAFKKLVDKIINI